MLKKQNILLLLIVLLLTGYNFSVYSPTEKIKLKIKNNIEVETSTKPIMSTNTGTNIETIPEIKNIKTPEKVKSIYYTSYSASREFKVKKNNFSSPRTKATGL